MPFPAFIRRTLAATALALGLWLPAAAQAAPASVAFFYGNNPPWDELQAFDWVVVDPDHVPLLPRLELKQSALFAYVAVGEVQPSRAYFKDIPQSWLLGANAAWGSKVIDQAQAGWPDFLAEKIVRPLWDQGYRGIFLDTLDSYQLYAKTPQARAAQENGMVEAILRLRAEFPGIKLFFNRGFEILPRLHREVAAVAAESLFEGWDAAKQTYRPVPENDRQWLLGQLHKVRDEYRLPVVAIDYVAPGKRDAARLAAEKIKQLGFIPWVSNPELNLLGVGALEVMPRKVLVVYAGSSDGDSGGSEYQLTTEPVLLYAAMPLNYLGYVPHYLDARKPLPDYPLAGRYAGIVTWFKPGETGLNPKLADWLVRQTQTGMKIAVLDSFGFALDGPTGKALDLSLPPPGATGKRLIEVAYQHESLGFETPLLPSRDGFFPLAQQHGETLLKLRDGNGAAMDAVAYMPWGGYALAPYSLIELPTDNGTRWVIPPIEFLRRALALPVMPVPDVTTENGRRLLLIHIDGDGFPSRAEFPGAPFAPEVLLKRVLEKYRIPTTMSVIQGEIAADGLYPQFSRELEGLARKMFALPHVELASHTYSHPFQWRMASAAGAAPGDQTTYHLDIPRYKFNLQAEVAGSIAYINRYLAPPGKRVKVFQWSGNCNPGKDALALVEQAGVLSINGGETLITQKNRSLSLVAPIGIWKAGHFQVYAPNQNENVYTGNWTGPYYGFREVLETFDLTDQPYRLKPINIYYHVYSASKAAALDALDKAYRHALSRPTMPIYTSEYILKAQDFNRALVVREGGGWRLYGGKHLRQWRLPQAAGWPDLAASPGIAGFKPHNDQLYLHAATDTATLKLAAAAPQTPYLVDANGRIEHFSRDSGNSSGMEISLRGHLPLQLNFANIQGCRMLLDGKPIVPKKTGDGLFNIELKNGSSATLKIGC